MTGETPPALVGKVLRVAEDDYLYGRGRLILRVTAVYNVQIYSSGRWVFLRGMELRASGSELGERNALVRLSAIRGQMDAPTPPSEPG
jgi:hypothetical protein